MSLRIALLLSVLSLGAAICKEGDETCAADEAGLAQMKSKEVKRHQQTRSLIKRTASDKYTCKTCDDRGGCVCDCEWAADGTACPAMKDDQSCCYACCCNSPDPGDEKCPDCSAEYGQCGGEGWTGSTCCAEGTTCQVQNAHYSQCLSAPALAQIEAAKAEATQDRQRRLETRKKIQAKRKDTCKTCDDRGGCKCDCAFAADGKFCPTATDDQSCCFACCCNAPQPGNEDCGTCAAKYEQCGGIGWTGAICCEDGSYCTPQAGNAHYAQCL